MKIGSLPISNQPVNSVTVGVAVLAKNLDTIKQAGDNMIKMMELSVQPNVGSNFDQRI
jgi:hypothetical protein